MEYLVLELMGFLCRILQNLCLVNSRNTEILPILGVGAAESRSVAVINETDFRGLADPVAEGSLNLSCCIFQNLLPRGLFTAVGNRRALNSDGGMTGPVVVFDTVLAFAGSVTVVVCSMRSVNV
jgi:hypothetical protein